MKRYPKYKSSNIPWIGEIPDHWAPLRLKWIVSINPSKGLYEAKKISDELVTFLPMEKVFEDGRFDTTLKKPINEVWNGFTFFQEGDVILAKITPCFENGKGALLINLGSAFGFGSTEFHVLRSKKKIAPKFLFYLTRTHSFRDVGEAMMFGAAGQKRIPASFLENYLMSLPSLTEQQQIAAYLDNKTQKIDKLISNKQKQIELLKEERQAVINSAVTGKTIVSRVRGEIGVADGLGRGIGDERGAVRGGGKGNVAVAANVEAAKVAAAAAAAHAAAKAAAEAASKSVKYKPSGITWLGNIPEHWEVKKLKYIAYLKSGEFINAEDISPVGDFPVLGGNGLRGYTNTYTHKGNFILIGRQGALCGNINLTDGKFYATEHAVVVTILDESDTIWLAELLRTMNLNQYSQASAQPGLAVETIKNLPIPFPPYAEQKTISSFLSQETEKINFTISKIEKEISLLQEFRTALISEVVTGKIDVREELVS